MATTIEDLLDAHEEVSSLLIEQGFGVNGIMDERAVTQGSSNFAESNCPLGSLSGLDSEQSDNPLLQRIDLLKKSNEVRSEMISLQDRLQTVTLQGRIADVYSVKSYNELSDWCASATESLATLCGSKDLLQYYLVQPPTNCLVMRRQHHQQFEVMLVN